MTLTLNLLHLQLWLIDYFYIIAGWLFALAGLLYTMAEISIYVIPGALRSSCKVPCPAY
jgi:hypothetical protein